MTEIENKIKLLSAYFSKRDDVIMAFVFGSYANKTAHQESDWDIAVYFKSITGTVEWENKERQYPEEDRIWNDCINILQTDNVDLLILNRAPASIAETAIRGIPLIIKDFSLFLKFMIIISQEAEDYRSFVNDYFAISQRSKSLTPIDQEILKKTINFLNEQLSLYDYFQKFSETDYHNIHKRNDVERWIENIINAAINIAKIILGSEKKEIPQTYRDALKQMTFILKLPPDTAEKFENWAKLRNILAHEYLDIKWKRISEFIKSSESYFQNLVKETEKFMEEKNKLKI